MRTESVNSYLARYAIIVLFCLLAVMALSSASATTYVVDDTVGPWRDFGSIQDAIDAASNGDTIEVYAGSYTENLIVEKRIDILGNGSASTTINADASGDTVTIKSSYVTLEGMSISGMGPGTTDAVIEVFYSNRCELRDLIIDDGDRGVYSDHSSYLTIEDVSISDCEDAGIQIFFGTGASIDHVYVSDIIDTSPCSCTGYGIYFEATSFNAVTNSEIYDNNKGIYLIASTYNSIEDCVIRNNTVFGVNLYQSSRNTISFNTISENGDYLNPTGNGHGIIVLSSHYIRIHNNTIMDNEYGITVTCSSFSTIVHNDCSYNFRYGIKIYCGVKHVVSYNTVNNTRGPCNLGGIIIASASQNTVIGNNVNYNHIGFRFQFSSDNLISGNMVTFNTKEGMAFSYSNENMVDNNTFLQNGGISIALYISHYNMIVDNYAYENNRLLAMSYSRFNLIARNTGLHSHLHGISLSYSDDNIIDNNTLLYGQKYGIYVYYSFDNVISSNNCSYSTTGIALSECMNNLIMENLCSFNSLHGIRLKDSGQNEIEANICYNNTMYGIYVYYSTDTLLVDNVCYHNDHGITLSGSDDNMLLDNVCVYNTWNIYLKLSENNILDGSTCWYGNYGIYNYLSDGTYIVNGSCGYNDRGIYLRESSNIDIMSVTLHLNEYGVFLYRNCEFVEIHYSSLLTNTWDVYNLNAYDVNATLNHWGTIYELTIRLYIWDLYDNPALGEVLYCMWYDAAFTTIYYCDHEAPISSKTIGDPQYGPDALWVTSSTPFNLTATDGTGVGVDAIYYTWTAGTRDSFDLYTGNFSFPHEGTYLLRWYAVDLLGNEEDIHEQTHHVDNTPPVISVTFGDPSEYMNNTWFIATNTTISIGATDAGVGVSTIMFRVFHNGNWSSWYSFCNFTILTEGCYKMQVKATDHLGHISYRNYSICVMDFRPIADAGPDVYLYEDDTYTTFNGSGSMSYPYDIELYKWDFGDGSPVTNGIEANHTYLGDDGTYTVTLTVRNQAGYYDTDTLTVYVMNLPPLVDAGLDMTVDEGEWFYLNGSFTDPGLLDSHNITWDLGDGNYAYGTLTPYHKYCDDGVYTVTLTVTDDDGGVGSDTLTMTVNNVAPMVWVYWNNTVTEGSAADFFGIFYDPGVCDTHTMYWDFDDGHTLVTTNYTDYYYVYHYLALNHTYCDDGSYNVTLTVVDDDGASDSGWVIINVTNVPPTVYAGPDRYTYEGTTILFNGSYSDVGCLDSHTYHWDFGDGSEMNGTLTPTHAYGDNGVYTVTLTVTDDDGGSTSDTLIVTVYNRPPYAYITSNQLTNITVLEGEQFPYYYYYYDYGWLDLLNVTIDFDDGYVIMWDDDYTGSGSGTYVYNEEGVYYIVITVVDDDGGSGSATLQVNVLNADPVVDAGPDQTTDEGVTICFNGSFIDIGHNDTYNITWDFGDGNYAYGNLTPCHAYGDNGNYTVTLTIRDSAGGVGNDTLLVTVHNVAPYVIVYPDQTINLCEEAFFYLYYRDQGWLDTLTVYLHMGDSTWINFSTCMHWGHWTGNYSYSAPGSYVVTLTVIDDDGGVGSDIMNVTVLDPAPIVDAGENITTNEATYITFNGSYTDCGPGNYTIHWDFGDGNTSTGSLDPTHRYCDNGIYTVTLTITDGSGNTVSDTLIVTVTNLAPSVSIYYDTTIYECQYAYFYVYYRDPSCVDTTTVLLTYGDGSSDTWTDDNFGHLYRSHQYMDDGTYTITLTVTDNNGGSSTDTMTVTVLNKVPCVDAGQDVTINEGSYVYFSGSFTDGCNDTHTYHWNFGDGNTTTGTLTPNHKYCDDGVYTVTLTVTDDDGGVGTDTLTVTVNNVAPSVYAGPDVTINEGEYAYFNGSFTDSGCLDTHTYHWDFGDGSPAATSLSTSHRYCDNGVYTVTLTVTDDDGGVGTDTLTVTVINVAPAVSIFYNSTIYECEFAYFYVYYRDDGCDDTVTVELDHGDGDVVTWTDDYYGYLYRSHQYMDDGTYTVTITVTDDDGASASDSIVITVLNKDPVVNAGNDVTINEGSYVYFTGSFTDGCSDTHTYHWDFGDGNTTTGTLTPNHKYCDDGVYTVTLTVTDDDGGIGTDTLTVTVNNVAPTVNAGPDVTIYEGQYVHFSGTFTDPGCLDTHSFHWDFGDGEETVCTQTPSHRYCDNGVFTVTFTVTDDDGGVGSDTLIVTVLNVAPNASIYPDQTIYEGDYAYFYVFYEDQGCLDTLTIEIDYKDGHTDSWTDDHYGYLYRSHQFMNAGIYYVNLTVTDDDGGVAYDCMIVTVLCRNHPPVPHVDIMPRANINPTPTPVIMEGEGEAPPFYPECPFCLPQNALDVRRGETVRFKGHWTDADCEDDHAYIFDWDNGRGSYSFSEAPVLDTYQHDISVLVTVLEDGINDIHFNELIGSIDDISITTALAGLSGPEPLDDGTITYTFDPLNAGDTIELTVTLSPVGSSSQFEMWLTTDGMPMHAGGLIGSTTSGYVFVDNTFYDGGLHEIDFIVIDDSGASGTFTFYLDVENGPNRNPVAIAALESYTTDTVTLTAEDSYDCDGYITNYTWDLGNSEMAYGEEITVPISSFTEYYSGQLNVQSHVTSGGTAKVYGTNHPIQLTVNVPYALSNAVLTFYAHFSGSNQLYENMVVTVNGKTSTWYEPTPNFAWGWHEFTIPGTFDFNAGDNIIYLTGTPGGNSLHMENCHHGDSGWFSIRADGEWEIGLTVTDNDGAMCNASFKLTGGEETGGWEYYRMITVDHTLVEQEFNDFPVLVSFTDADIKDTDHGGPVQPDGDDIRFVSLFGDDLSHEIELYDGSIGRIVAWVKVPVLYSSVDTRFYMYYGNPAVGDQQDVEGVWTPEFKMVHHMEEDPSGTAPQLIDSTSNDIDGTSGGYMTSSDLIEAAIGKGLAFDGCDDFFDLGTTSLVSSTWTVDFWVYPTCPENYDRVFLQGINTGRGRNIMVYWHTDHFEIYTITGCGNPGDPQAATGRIPTYQWSHVVWTFDGTTHRLYVNGVPSSGATTGWNVGVGGNLYIGRRDCGNYWTGSMDEMRVLDTALSASWIKTAHANQVDPAGFITIGDPIELGSKELEMIDFRNCYSDCCWVPRCQHGIDGQADVYWYVDEEIEFDATGSVDWDGHIVSYEWDFGDGNTATGFTVSNSWENTGNYTVTLTVTDNEGYTDTDRYNVVVEDGCTEYEYNSGVIITLDNHTYSQNWYGWSRHDNEQHVTISVPVDVYDAKFTFYAGFSGTGQGGEDLTVIINGETNTWYEPTPQLAYGYHEFEIPGTFDLYAGDNTMVLTGPSGGHSVWHHTVSGAGGPGWFKFTGTTRECGYGRVPTLASTLPNAQCEDLKVLLPSQIPTDTIQVGLYDTGELDAQGHLKSGGTAYIYNTQHPIVLEVDLPYALNDAQLSFYGHFSSCQAREDVVVTVNGVTHTWYEPTPDRGAGWYEFTIPGTFDFNAGLNDIHVTGYTGSGSVHFEHCHGDAGWFRITAPGRIVLNGYSSYDLDSCIVNYTWNLLDMELYGPVLAMEIPPDAPTCFNVTLTVRDIYGVERSLTRRICQTTEQAIIDGGPDRTIYEGDTIWFNATTDATLPYTIEWDFGDGSTATGASVSHIYMDDGLYEVEIELKKGGMVIATDTVLVTVLDRCPTATITYECDISTSTGFFGRYYNLPSNHPDVETAITGVVTGDNPYNHDWFDDDYLSFTRVDQSINNPSSWYPVNEGMAGDPYYFAVHWSAVAVVQTAGYYNFVLSSDDDSWVYVNGVMEADMGGIHALTTTTESVYLNQGANCLEIFFAERHVVQSGMVFYFSTPGVTIRPCVIYEGDEVEFHGSVESWPDDIVSIVWDFGDGNTATGDLDPTHTYGDNGMYTVQLTVTDEDGSCDTDVVIVHVMNKCPDLKIYNRQTITMRVSGVVGGTVELQIIQNGAITASLNLSMSSSNSGTIQVDIDMEYFPYAKLVFDSPCHNVGYNYVWLSAHGVERYITCFTVNSYSYSWHQEYNFDIRPVIYIHDKQIQFRAESTDPGSDDLTFEWEFGDGSSDVINTHYNNGVSPDPVFSPGGTFPFYVEDVVYHTYSQTYCGQPYNYYMTVTVTDDDGCSTSLTVLVDP